MQDSDKVEDYVLHDIFVSMVPDMENSSDIEYYKNMMDFVSMVVLTHEIQLFDIINKRYGDNYNVKSNILTADNELVFKIITTMAEHYYNKLYVEIKENADTHSVNTVKKISDMSGYTTDVLLDKLFRLSIEINIEIDRNKLCIDTADTYKESVWNEISSYFEQRQIMEVMKIDLKKNASNLVETNGKVFCAQIFCE